MNNLCTLLNSISQMSSIDAQQMDDICDLIATVVKDDLGSDSKFLITNWVGVNDGYNDFSFALRPAWLVGTPDGKEVKMCISIDTCDQSWYVHLVMDCDNGECEEWGEKEFNRSELEDYSMPVKTMLEVIHKQYEKKLHEENAKSVDADLAKAAQVAEQLQNHVDAIKALCRENKINICVDFSVDGTNCLYLVPDSMDFINDADDDDVEAIKLEKIPYLDLGARAFDSNIDMFGKIK